MHRSSRIEGAVIHARFNAAFAPEKFDLIIFGFCLYLTDWSDWFRIVAEADTVLRQAANHHSRFQ